MKFNRIWRSEDFVLNFVIDFLDICVDFDRAFTVVLSLALDVNEEWPDHRAETIYSVGDGSTFLR